MPATRDRARLRGETSPNTWTVTVVCAECGASFQPSQRRATGNNVCHGCRHPATYEPDESHHRRVENIPEARLADLFAVAEALR